MTAAAVTPSARRAALVAHGMQPQDRQWLLEALGPEERALLRPLLQELQALGIPSDDGLLRDVMASAPTSPGQRLERLGPHEVPALIETLRGESAELARVVLESRGWWWCEQVAVALDLEPALERPAAPPAPALQEALCRVIVNAIETARRPDPTPPARIGRRWRRIFGERA
jgi:hypothetical protein